MAKVHVLVNSDAHVDAEGYRPGQLKITDTGNFLQFKETNGPKGHNCAP